MRWRLTWYPEREQVVFCFCNSRDVDLTECNTANAGGSCRLSVVNTLPRLYQIECESRRIISCQLQTCYDDNIEERQLNPSRPEVGSG